MMIPRSSICTNDSSSCSSSLPTEASLLWLSAPTSDAANPLP